MKKNHRTAPSVPSIKNDKDLYLYKAQIDTLRKQKSIKYENAITSRITTDTADDPLRDVSLLIKDQNEFTIKLSHMEDEIGHFYAQIQTGNRNFFIEKITDGLKRVTYDEVIPKNELSVGMLVKKNSITLTIVLITYLRLFKTRYILCFLKALAKLIIIEP